MIRHYAELRVYREACEVALRVFEASKGWPREERYALTDQVRRSSRAVCALLAEAWAKRRYPKHFVSKLTDAHGESEETQVWLQFARDHGYLAPETHEPLAADLREVSGGLVRMMRAPDQWCGPSLLREEEASYDASSPVRRPPPLLLSPPLLPSSPPPSPSP